MKVAVFSDVHGNAVALNRFLDEVRDSVHGYICLGDVVGYGPDNDECLETISKLPNMTLLGGNHEEMFRSGVLLECSPLAAEFYRWSRKYFTRFELLPEQDELRWQQWHFLHTFKVDGRWQYIRDAGSLPDCIISNCCIGHTHYQSQMLHKGYSIVNCGSIGQNRGNKSRACFAVLDTDTGVVELRSISYDRDLFVARLVQRGYPDHLCSYYLC